MRRRLVPRASRQGCRRSRSCSCCPARKVSGCGSRISIFNFRFSGAHTYTVFAHICFACTHVLKCVHTAGVLNHVHVALRAEKMTTGYEWKEGERDTRLRALGGTRTRSEHAIISCTHTYSQRSRSCSCCSACRERFFIELMTSDRKPEPWMEGSKMKDLRVHTRTRSVR